MKNISLHRCTIILALVFSQCAQQVAPTGGNKDQLPPILVKSKPENHTTSIYPEKLIMHFDEYFLLNQISQNLLITPSLDKPPKVRIVGKKLEIDLSNQSLDSNTTYIFSFNEAIKDLNEGNKLDLLQFIFSTNTFIDSNSISGKVVDAFSNKGIPNSLVLLYQANHNTPHAIRDNKPYYLTKTDKDGSYKISYVKRGSYYLFSLEDGNLNQLFDLLTEKIGFYDTTSINIDTALDNYVLRQFSDQKPIKLLSYKFTDIGKVSLEFNQYPLGITIESTGNDRQNSSSQLIEIDSAKNTIHYWVPNNTTDSLKFTILHQSNAIDTITLQNNQTSLDSVSIQNYQLNLKLIPKDAKLVSKSTVRIISSQPIKTIDSSLIRFTQDSIPISFSASIANDNPRKLIITADTEVKKEYHLFFDKDAIQSIYNISNDSSQHSFSIANETELGTLKLNIQTDSLRPRNVIFQLYSKDIIKNYHIHSDTTIFLSKQKPIEYQLRVIDDSDNNHIWSTGKFSNYLQPEKVSYYSKTISIKSNWETEYDINLMDSILFSTY